jgi:hypothetical protein
MDPIDGTTAGAIHLTGWQMGRDEERARILKIIARRVCFDNLENGGCDHAVCYNNLDLISFIRKGNK